MESWEEIYNLEITEQYPAAIEAIEERLKSNSEKEEGVIHLGFLYWLGIVEDERLNLNVSFQQYAARFRELLNTYQSVFDNNADFCFSYGFGLSMDYYYFARDAKDTKELNLYESLGKSLLEKAKRLSPFYKKLLNGKVSQQEISQHFAKRGCFLKYYSIV